MNPTIIRPSTKWRNSRLALPTSQSKFLGVLSVLLGIAVVLSVVLIWTAPAIDLSKLGNPAAGPPGNATVLSANDPNRDMAAFEDTSRNLAQANSPQAFQTLLQSLRSGELLSQRSYVLTVLKDASPSVVPVLINALNDSDTSVRAGAAAVLGMRRESQAIVPLTAATRDADAGVRLQSVTALGLLGAWEVSPRLDQMQVNETNYEVRQAASAAKEIYRQEIAQAIGVLPTELRDVSVTTGDVPNLYAVTTSHLYTLHGTASWTPVGQLPDFPLAIATGADPDLIYLATARSGLYRSLDGGATWDHVQFGLQTPTQLTVTAVVVNPQDSRQFFIALASPGAASGLQNAVGIYANTDGGSTWVLLPNSPATMITTRLVIDPQQPGYLFGMAADTPWRYELSSHPCEYCLD